MANFARLSEMKQNPANLATFLLIICRNKSKPVKYSPLEPNTVQLSA